MRSSGLLGVRFPASMADVLLNIPILWLFSLRMIDTSSQQHLSLSTHGIDLVSKTADSP